MAEGLLVKRFIFKELVEGDFRKFIAQSNDTDTGGGARDLRYKPQKIFYPFFEKMMAVKNADNTLDDIFHWEIEGKVITTKVKVHPPTNSRPNEIRIARVHQCIPDEVVPQNHNNAIFLIVQYSDNSLWPYFVTIDSIRNDDWDPIVKRVITEAYDVEKRENITATGYYDYETGEEYYYGK
jgi:hypothetical protein